jgi:hypothetical protein
MRDKSAGMLVASTGRGLLRNWRVSPSQNANKPAHAYTQGDGVGDNMHSPIALDAYLAEFETRSMRSSAAMGAPDTGHLPCSSRYLTMRA